MQTNNSELYSASSELLAKEAVKILIEKKGLNISLYDVRESSSITDFYINVTGSSTTHQAALGDNLSFLLGERGRDPLRVEGKRGNSWILVDYGDVIINIFDRQSREFYNLDRHFSENNKVDISELVREVDLKFDVNSN